MDKVKDKAKDKAYIIKTYINYFQKLGINHSEFYYLARFKVKFLMPCIKCGENMYKWGDNGKCKYASLGECEKDNQDYYAKSKLNQKAYSHAKSLISDDKVDKNSKWSFSSQDGNTLLGEDGEDWDNYSKWFLLIDEDAAKETKGRYKFPYGKKGKVYRSGLTAIRQRAGQFGYDDIFQAAGKLIEQIDEKDKEEKLNRLIPSLIRRLKILFN